MHASNGLTPTEYRFTGQLEQNSLGLYFYLARWYDPYLNQFVQPDTYVPESQEAQAYDRYAYTYNNPLNYIDPDGHFPIPPNIPLAPLFNFVFTGWYTGAITGYEGTGGWLGHGPRQVAAKVYGIENGGEAQNLPQLLMHSLLQSEDVNITGDALENLKQDPRLLAFEADIVEYVQNVPEYGNEAFTFQTSDDLTFGGPRAPGDMWRQLPGIFNSENSDTWQVAGNETAWTVRCANVYADVDVTLDGMINISYSITDTYDLRPVSGRTFEYNATTAVLGFFWHDVFGGNAKMKTHSNWQTEKMR